MTYMWVGWLGNQPRNITLGFESEQDYHWLCIETLAAKLTELKVTADETHSETWIQILGGIY